MGRARVRRCPACGVRVRGVPFVGVSRVVCGVCRGARVDVSVGVGGGVSVWASGCTCGCGSGFVCEFLFCFIVFRLLLFYYFFCFRFFVLKFAESLNEKLKTPN